MTAWLRHEWCLLRVALQFLTRLPLRIEPFDAAWLNACVRHFPLVGALVGAAGAAVLLAAAALWPPLLAVLLSMAATVLLTGGFHEDGLADTCDGLGGAVSRTRALAIMKDSRLGSYGALGLALVLALKAAALTTLAQRAPAVAALALLGAHGLSRGAAVLVMAWLPYGGDAEHAKAKPLAIGVGRTAVAVALAWCALLLALLLALSEPPGPPGLPGLPGLPWAVAAVAALAVAGGCARWYRRRLGGYTGDTLGATQQFSELAVYLTLAAWA